MESIDGEIEIIKAINEVSENDSPAKVETVYQDSTVI